jgi:hypothetical protein
MLERRSREAALETCAIIKPMSGCVSFAVMAYTQTDALYDIMAVQVPVSLLITFVFTMGALQQEFYHSVEGLVGFITLFMIIWFSLMLMFFIIDLLVLTFVFSVLRFWHTLRCVKNE